MTTLRRLDAITCPSHGYLGHTAIHEAAHAVFAIDLGIPFISVSIAPSEQVLASLMSDTVTVGGGVDVGDFRECFFDRPEEALDFCLAGSRTEHSAYGHHLEQSYLGDLYAWKRGTDFASLDSEKFTQLRGASIERVDARLSSRYHAVVQVAHALTAAVDADENGRYTSFDGAMLTLAQVSELLEA